jgi:hypothetical protein
MWRRYGHVSACAASRTVVSAPVGATMEAMSAAAAYPSSGNNPIRDDGPERDRERQADQQKSYRQAGAALDVPPNARGVGEEQDLERELRGDDQRRFAFEIQGQHACATRAESQIGEHDEDLRAGQPSLEPRGAKPVDNERRPGRRTRS